MEEPTSLLWFNMFNFRPNSSDTHLKALSMESCPTTEMLEHESKKLLSIAAKRITRRPLGISKLLFWTSSLRNNGRFCLFSSSCRWFSRVQLLSIWIEVNNSSVQMKTCCCHLDYFLFRFAVSANLPSFRLINTQFFLGITICSLRSVRKEDRSGFKYARKKT